jgi:predicted Zn-dependent peptidase
LGFPDVLEQNNVPLVLLQRASALVAIDFLLEGGPRGATPPRLAGIDGLLLTYLTQAASTAPPDSFARLLEAASAKLEVHLNRDYSIVRLHCLRESFSEVLPLVCQALFQPVFEKDRFEAIRHDYASQLLRGTSTAWGELDSIGQELYFEDHPYRWSLAGAYRQMADLKFDSLQAHYHRLVGNTRLHISIVGDLRSEVVQDALAPFLDSLPETRAALGIEERILSESSAHFVSHEGDERNYILGQFAAPSMGDENEWAFRLAMQMLQNRLVDDLCTRRALSCELLAEYHPQLAGYATLALSCRAGNATVKALLDQLESIRGQGFKPAELQRAQQDVLTQLYRTIEPSAGMATELARCSYYQSLEGFLRMPEKVAALRLADVNRVFNEYTKAIQWTYYGDTRNIGRGIFRN